MEWNRTESASIITDKLIKFRRSNVVGARCFKILNDIRVLSLSFIFVFGHTAIGAPRLCEYLKTGDYSSYSRPSIIAPILKKFSTKLYTHDLDRFDFNTSGSADLTIKIIVNVYGCFQSRNFSTAMTECQFSKLAIFPLLAPLFFACRYFEISKYDRTMVAMEDYKPDVLILLKLKYDVRVDFFICEIKKPGCLKNKYESDFVKKQREMKAMVDEQVELGINDLSSFGILIEGYGCYLYKMTLSYDAEYCSCVITQFRILRDPQDTMLLLPATNVLSYLHEELEQLKSKMLKIGRSRRGLSSKALYRRPSFTKAVKKQ